MQALVYTDTQTLIYREEKNPELVNGESIIKVSASGICGSDMHAYHGKDNRRIPPLILGHEISGIIDKGKSNGKEVVLNPLITCGKCDYCQSGREHLCNKRIILGMNRPIERQGGFAEYVSIPDQNIYELPKELSMKEAPIAEPTAVALHAVELGEQSLSKPIENTKILVIGGGAIGLLSGLILSKVFFIEFNFSKSNSFFDKHLTCLLIDFNFFLRFWWPIPMWRLICYSFFSSKKSKIIFFHKHQLLIIF